VTSILWAVDAVRILQIPITNGREDYVAWHYNRNGLFTVRLAYHCQWEDIYGRRHHVMQASGAGKSHLWKKLWKLQVPERLNFSDGEPSTDEF